MPVQGYRNDCKTPHCAIPYNAALLLLQIQALQTYGQSFVVQKLLESRNSKFTKVKQTCS
jgi:hypothetical protein